MNAQAEMNDPPEEVLRPLSDTVTKTLLESRKSFIDFLRRHLPDAEIAEDMFQQNLLKALNQSVPLKDPESVIPWFYRILRNALTDFYRTRASEGRKNENFVRFLEDEGMNDPDVHASICGCMKDLIPSLKAEYASLIQQVDLEGRSIGGIAKEQGISPNTLTVRLHRARQALRTSLIRACGACTEHGCLDCTCKKHPRANSMERV